VAEPQDFTAFYASAFARLVGQLALVTGELQEAEDVVQEAFARASMRWSRLREYEVPEAWVRVPSGTVKARLARGRQRLAALLRERDQEQTGGATAP